jgi:hypothetical protein
MGACAPSRRQEAARGCRPWPPWAVCLGGPAPEGYCRPTSVAPARGAGRRVGGGRRAASGGAAAARSRSAPQQPRGEIQLFPAPIWICGQFSRSGGVDRSSSTEKCSRWQLLLGEKAHRRIAVYSG